MRGRHPNGHLLYRPVVAVSLLRGWAIGGTHTGDVVGRARADWSARVGVSGWPELRRLMAPPCCGPVPCGACSECGLDLPPERAAQLVRWLERTGDTTLVADRWSWVEARPTHESARAETGRVETVWSWDSQLVLCAASSTAQHRGAWMQRWEFVSRLAPDAALYLLERRDLPRYVRREPRLLAGLLMHERQDIREAACRLADALP